MEHRQITPGRWTPALVGTIIVRFVGAACLVKGAFWLLDWISYRVQYSDTYGTSVEQDLAYAVAALRFLVVGGLVLLFEPKFVRWLLGGTLGSRPQDTSAPPQEFPPKDE